MGLTERNILILRSPNGDGGGQPVLPGMEGLVRPMNTEKKKKQEEKPKKEKGGGYHPIVPVPASLRNQPPAHRMDIDGFRDDE